MTGQSHSREALSTLLWPDYDQSRARSYLRHTLWVLKKALGKSRLAISREQVEFDLAVETWLDVAVFQEYVAAVSAHEHAPTEACPECLAWLAEAVEVYGGDFLAGFTLPDAPEFDEWQFFQMEELRQKLAGALECLVTGLSDQGQYEAALPHARRWLALDPLHEPAQRSLLQLYAETGQQAVALRQYEQYVELLDKEFGLPPEEETVTLYEAIKAKRFIAPLLKAEKQNRKAGAQRGNPSTSSGTGAGEQEPVLSPAPPPPVPFPEDTIPAETEGITFVARQQEMDRLDAFLKTMLAGQNQVAFVAGEAGQGKTALLQAFARHAQQTYPDLIVAGGNCNAYTGLGDPYLPFREILELLTGDIEARAVAGALHREQASRLWQTLPLTVQALVETAPDLLDTFIPAQNLLNRVAAFAPVEGAWWGPLQTLVANRATRPDAANVQQSALFEQYSRLMQALARQSPLLLILDDLQWADPGSVSLLFHLGRRLTGYRLLILGAYRPNEIASARDGKSHPLAPIVHQFQGDFGDITLDLSQAEGQAFVDAWLDSQPNRFDSLFRQTLYRQTGGHPLFTIELLRGMQERGDLVQDEAGVWEAQTSLNWNTLPARVEGAIGQRISRLDTSLQELLQVASVEGEEFTAEVVAQVLNLDEREVVRRLSRDLDKTHALVRAIGTRRVGDRRLSRYRFRHNLIQLYLYNLLDEVERVYQHETVGNALERLYGEQATEMAVQLARHFEVAEIPEKAVIYLRLAGDQARRAVAFAEAIRYYQAALTYWPDTDQVGRAEILRHLGECRWMIAQLQEALDTFDISYNLFEAQGNVIGAGAVLGLMGRIYWELGKREKSLQSYYHAFNTLEQVPESVELARTMSRISGMHMAASKYEEAIDWGKRALALAERLDAEDVVAHALNNIGTSYIHTGDPERGRMMLQESADRALELGLPHDVCRAYHNLATSHLTLGLYAEAKIALDKQLAYAEPAGVTLFARDALVERTRLDWLTGQWQIALVRCPQILDWLGQEHVLGWVEVGASRLLGIVYNDVGQFQKAYDLLEKGTLKARRFNESQFMVPHLREVLRALPALEPKRETTTVVRELLDWINQPAHGYADTTMALLVVCQWLSDHPTPGILDETKLRLARLEQAVTEIGNLKAEAILSESRGVLNLMDGDVAQAVERFQYAVEAWQQVGQPYDQARALNGLGQALLLADELDQARIAFDQASDIIEMLAAQLEDAELKTSFLNSPLVQKICYAQAKLKDST